MDYHLYQLEEEFGNLSWDDVYSFVEFSLDSLNQDQSTRLEKRLNKVFQDEGVQYQIINGTVNSLLSEIEMDEISTAQGLGKTSSAHISKAIELFNKRPTPDYSNSIKESISAVESIAKEICGDDSAVLSDAVKKMELHPALSQGIVKIYAWTSDEGGIRHSLKEGEDSTHGEPEARYLLVLCSALVSFLNLKNSQTL